jgi:hypothetical protein
VSWIDRITGKCHDVPVAPFVPGQWQYAGAEELLVRDALARNGDLLLPSSDGRCGAASLGSLRTDARLVPDDDALLSLRLIGQRLERLQGRTWREWIAETPVLPMHGDALEESALERLLADRLGDLDAACHRPRTHLKLEEERLLVSRCQRPSPRAPAVLSARSEDWERRTMWGIRPRRVLGVVRDELHDIYENRLAVALVDNLDRALLARIRAVRRLVDLLRQKQDYQHVLEGSHNYRRARRVLDLWAETLGDEEQLAHAQGVLDRLVRLRRRVIALQDTQLYQSIALRQTSRLHLRMTNVLAHDPVYRGVAALWQGWEKHVRDRAEDPEERWRQEQESARAFVDFTFLTILRALATLGFAASQNPALGGNGQWQMHGPTGPLALGRDDSAITLLSARARAPLRIIAVPAMLEASASISGWVNALPRDGMLIVVSLPCDASHAPPDVRVRLRSLGNQGDGDGHAFVRVAPWDLESVERMARAIRWYAWTELYERFPFAVARPGGWATPADPPPWIRPGNSELRVVRPAFDHERDWRALDERITRGQRHAEAKQSELSALSPRENRKRLHIRHELEQSAPARASDQKVRDALREALSFADRLLQCPICQTHGDPGAFEEATPLFRCRCPECDAQWGLRSCASCDRPFPFLKFAGNVASSDLLAVDRHYGCDVLAVPIDERAFLCPHCGKPTDGGTSDEQT